MRSVIKLFILISILAQYAHISPTAHFAPEICNNGVDDDNDGHIDLHDEDCYCKPLEQMPLIANPSFENQECCPAGHTQLDCAKGWIQASEGTPDYFHACDYDGSFFNLPRPIPDGEGFAGIIDGSFTGKLIPELKEYLASCLVEPLEKDTLYRLDFYTGFMDSKSSPDIEIALFGTDDCANVPFGIDDKAFGCPANSPKWVQLGSVSLSGENQWVRSNFKFKPNVEIKAIAIGPSCVLRSSTNNTYHFLDQLILKESNKFDLGIQANGEPCMDDFFLAAKELKDHSYQWYKDGIAIPLAQSNSLYNPPGAGAYQIRVQNSDGCKISNPYSYTPPLSFIKTTDTICAGENYDFYNNFVSDPGVYWDTVTTVNNCERIVRLDLHVQPLIETHINTKIFPNESFEIGSFSFTMPGEYIQAISASSGCDSTVHLYLEHYRIYIPNAFSPNADGVNDIFSIGESIDLKHIVSLEVFNRWGELIFREDNLRPGDGWNGTFDSVKAPSGVYTYNTQIVTSDDRERSLQGMVTLVR